MNPTDDITSTGGDDRRFDLLVDGELSEAQRSDLLKHLDDEPEGWRRCALAFLEAQCWKQELGPIAHPPVPVSLSLEPLPKPAAPRSNVRRWTSRLGTLLAMAASFLVALGLGMQMRDRWSPGPVAATNNAGSQGGTTASQEPGMPGARQQLAPVPELVTVPAAPQRSEGPADRWEMVTLASDGQAGAEETIRLPAVQRDAIDPKWFEKLPGAIPQDVLQAFQRTGHEVQQHRELVPVQMQDGRRLVVPVDKVEVHYVGRPAL